MPKASPRRGGQSSLKIRSIEAFPTSFPLPQNLNVRLGIGRAVKRDAVIVKVTTEAGLVGWGEAHHARAPGSVAHLINTTLTQLVLGMDATDVVGVWQKIYDKQLGSHGMGAGAAMAMSGIDMALWDIRGKAVGCRSTSCSAAARSRFPPMPAACRSATRRRRRWSRRRAPRRAGYKAVKLRVGDNPKGDLARIAAVRKAFGDDLVILTDANTGYTWTTRAR